MDATEERLAKGWLQEDGQAGLAGLSGLVWPARPARPARPVWPGPASQAGYAGSQPARIGAASPTVKNGQDAVKTRSR